MDSLLINGGNSLFGDIYISGAKNAVLPIMIATLLSDESICLNNVPALSDVYTLKSLLENHGANIQEKRIVNKNDEISLSLNMCAENLDNFTAPYEIVRKMRASFWVIAPIVTRLGKAKISLPGGCAIGARQIDLHIALLESMGVKIDIRDGYVCAEARGRLQACEFDFSKTSVGATVTAILASVLASGTSKFTNCAIEPEIADLCHFLNKIGAKISNIGTSNLVIEGVDRLSGGQHSIIADRIEAGTYMMAVAATKGNVNIHNIGSDILENVINPMKDAGINITIKDNVININQENCDIKSVNINTNPYPGFATDLQAQFMALMCLADGESKITENMFENRFMQVPELCRMGAKITIQNNTAIITGVKNLYGAEVMASDLRASVCLVIGGLVAQGTTKVNRIYHLDRGYQDLVGKLSKCGADITRIA